jgi:hypothetical protein
MSKSKKVPGVQIHDWRYENDPNLKGAGYLLTQRGRLQFVPSEYITFRAMERSRSSQLLQEWDRWMRDLGKSTHTVIQRAVKSAPSMTVEELDQHYRNRYAADRELDTLENSARQLAEADRDLALLVQERRGKQSLNRTQKSMDQMDALD